MQLAEAQAAIEAVLGELPRQIHDSLEHVTCRLLDWPLSDVRPDAKGVYLGVQQEMDGDEVTAAAIGTILLFAGNLANGQEAQQALLHEVGHALGFSEWEVFALGLAA